MSMKPKTNRTGDTSARGAAGYDCCQTPPYALDPLLPYLPKTARVWEPAAGEGYLAAAIADAGLRVMTSDIQTGRDFFDDDPGGWDLLVTNPPYSIKYDWLARCYALGRPFALLVPLEMIGAQKAQRLMQRHGGEVMLLSRRVNFKMPQKGWAGSAAQFPVIWLCWRLLPAPLVYGDIVPRADGQLTLLEAA